MSRPIVFSLLAVLAATLASLLVYTTLKHKDEEVRRALAGTTPIVVAAHDLAVGMKLDAGSVKLARWPKDGLPPSAVVDPRSVLGEVAKSEFVENQPIVSDRLVAGDKTSGVLPLMIPSDLRAMSVAVDEVADIAGFVLPYTRVDVLLSLPASNNQPSARAKIILENVPVLAVAQTVARKDNPQPERVVTLLVTPEQSEELALASNEGKLHLAMRSYGDNNVVATSGSDVKKVMAAYATESAEPVNIPPQQAVHIRIPLRRFTRARPLEQVEVFRNGRSREAVLIGPDGRAAPTPSGAPAESTADEGTTASARPTLGSDDSAGVYSDGIAPVGGISAGTIGMEQAISEHY